MLNYKHKWNIKRFLWQKKRFYCFEGAFFAFLFFAKNKITASRIKAAEITDFKAKQKTENNICFVNGLIVQQSTKPP